MTTTTTSTSSSVPASSPTTTLPLGVAILAILIGIYGFFVFLIGLLIAVGSTILAAYGGANPLGHFGYSGTIAGLIILIVGLIILALAVGLWNLRMWALVLTVLFLIIEMVIYALAGAFITFGFIAAVILFVYLVAVSKHFT
jgi:hypothetical protein